jgi:hypothetical protein
MDFDRIDTNKFFECANRMIDLYISYRQRFVIMEKGAIFIPKIRKGGKEITMPLTNRIVCGHLNRNFAIGVFAGEYSSKFICFDVDEGGIEMVRKIVGIIDDLGISSDYIHVSSSGGKGYHIEIFFDDLVYTNKLRTFYDMVCIKGSLDPRKIEFRPTFKQSIKLPLSKHCKTGKECLFLNKETWEPCYGMEYLLTIKRFHSGVFNEIVDSLPLSEMKGDIPDLREANKEEYRLLNPDGVVRLEGDGYPMLTKQGECNSTMLAIVVHNRYRGLNKEESEKELTEWLAKQDEAYITDSEFEMQAKIRGMIRWAYSDKFVINKSVPFVVTKEEMQFCLSAKEKSERKILFLILLFQKKYSKLRMSYEAIAGYTGNSRIAVLHAVDRLFDKGNIFVAKEKPILKDGSFVAKCNSYKLNHLPEREGEKILEVDEVSKENFLSLYHDCVIKTAGKENEHKYFSKKELDKLYA